MPGDRIIPEADRASLIELARECGGAFTPGGPRLQMDGFFVTAPPTVAMSESALSTFASRIRKKAMEEAAKPIESAPTDRDIMVYNGMYGWYRTRGYSIDGDQVWPLYGLFGADGGVWYPVPSHWMELPPTPEGCQPAMSSCYGSVDFYDKRYLAERRSAAAIEGER
jgi:hypothetical protein